MAYFEAVQWLPVELPKVFAFFSYPANLPRIMPPELQVRIEMAALVPPVNGDSTILQLLEMDKLPEPVRSLPSPSARFPSYS
jgi:hypothetical protein